jgi:hypothetical protein
MVRGRGGIGMYTVAGHRIALCITGICCLAITGCISHDQVHLPNPAPCQITCQNDWLAPVDPICHGYHATCWKPWCGTCPACPAPTTAAEAHGPSDSSPLPEMPPSSAAPTDAVPEHHLPLEPIPAPIERDSSSSDSYRPALLVVSADPLSVQPAVHQELPTPPAATNTQVSRAGAIFDRTELPVNAAEVRRATGQSHPLRMTGTQQEIAASGCSVTKFDAVSPAVHYETQGAQPPSTNLKSSSDSGPDARSQLHIKTMEKAFESPESSARSQRQSLEAAGHGNERKLTAAVPLSANSCDARSAADESAAHYEADPTPLVTSISPTSVQLAVHDQTELRVKISDTVRIETNPVAVKPGAYYERQAESPTPGVLKSPWALEIAPDDRAQDASGSTIRIRLPPSTAGALPGETVFQGPAGTLPEHSFVRILESAGH